MPIRLAQLSSPSQLDEFVNLPFTVHKDHPLWTPPLKKDEKFLLSPKHPFWATAQRELFIAYENNRPLGRIAAIIDHKYNDYAGTLCGAFGFFECEKNYAAAHALLEAAWNFCDAQGMDYFRGPLNPSTNYTCGMLVDGFALPPALMMPWNPPWYPAFMETWHMHKEQDLFAYTIKKSALSLPDWLKNELSAIKSENRFTYRSSSKATMKEDVRAMLHIYRESWSQNWGFSPLSSQEAELLVKELSAILDPEFFMLFFFQGKPVGGMVALPNLNPLLARLKGSFGPLLPWHYFKTRKEIRKGYRIMLFGILPEYRMAGLPMLLLDEMLRLAKTHPGLEWVEGSWVLESNEAIDDLIEDFGGILTKRYRIYRKNIRPC